MSFQYLKGNYKEVGDRFINRDSSTRTSGNGFKLKDGRSRLDIMKTFFTIVFVKHYQRLPREVVGAPSLETFSQFRWGSEQTDLVKDIPAY